MTDSDEYWHSAEARLHHQVVGQMKLLEDQDRAASGSDADWAIARKHSLITTFIFSKSRVTSVRGNEVSLSVPDYTRPYYRFDDRATEKIRTAFNRVMGEEVNLEIVIDMDNPLG